MTRFNKVDHILEVCSDLDIEIVSYGLAPNPNGFCYEAPDKTTYYAHAYLSELFDSLDEEETQTLRNYVFGDEGDKK